MDQYDAEIPLVQLLDRLFKISLTASYASTATTNNNNNNNNSNIKL